MMVYGSIAIYVIAGFTLPVLVYQMAISVALNGTAPLVIQTSNCRKKCLLRVLLCPLCRYLSNIVQQLKTLSMASPIRRNQLERPRIPHSIHRRANCVQHLIIV